MTVRVRGTVNSTATSYPQALTGSRKTSWVRARGGKGRAPGRWNLVEHFVPSPRECSWRIVSFICGAVIQIVCGRRMKRSESGSEGFYVGMIELSFPSPRLGPLCLA